MTSEYIETDAENLSSAALNATATLKQCATDLEQQDGEIKKLKLLLRRMAVNLTHAKRCLTRDSSCHDCAYGDTLLKEAKHSTSEHYTEDHPETTEPGISRVLWHEALLDRRLSAHNGKPITKARTFGPTVQHVALGCGTGPWWYVDSPDGTVKVLDVEKADDV